jgi:hypothetical protein
MKIQGVPQTENYIKQNLKKNQKNGKPWFLFFIFLYFF